MLTIKNKKLKPVTFNWEDEGETVQLMITQMTVADNMKLAGMHTKILADENLSEEKRNALFLTSRVACSIKTLEGEYFFTKDLEEINELLTGDVLYQLSTEAMALNPVNTDSIDEAKK